MRVLPIGPQLLARLRVHWELQQAERRARGARWHEHGLIICHEDGQPITSLTLFNYDLLTLSRALGLGRLNPHRLRHSFATLVADEGYSESVVAALLGHKRGGSITARYVHAKPKTMRMAVELVEARILGSTEAMQQEAR